MGYLRGVYDWVGGELTAVGVAVGVLRVGCGDVVSGVAGAGVAIEDGVVGFLLATEIL